jgi:hypothetical protein
MRNALLLLSELVTAVQTRAQADQTTILLFTSSKIADQQVAAKLDPSDKITPSLQMTPADQPFLAELGRMSTQVASAEGTMSGAVRPIRIPHVERPGDCCRLGASGRVLNRSYDMLSLFSCPPSSADRNEFLGSGE